MTTELEQEFFKSFDMGKPVIKKWYYEGYYEDFSWQYSEEDCTKLLKYFNNSVDKLNDRIQQMKKEKNTKFDRYTDSVDTECGRLSGAYIIYPKITDHKLLEIICILNKEAVYGYSDWGGKFIIGETVEELKESILTNCIRNKSKIFKQIQQLFKD